MGSESSLSTRGPTSAHAPNSREKEGRKNEESGDERVGVVAEQEGRRRGGRGIGGAEVREDKSS